MNKNLFLSQEERHSEESPLIYKWAKPVTTLKAKRDKASAAVPRLYRIKFGRDIYKDLRQLEKSVGENEEDSSNLDLFSLEMFEDLAWLMARHADPAKVPDSPEEFLDQFNTFSIYQILTQLIELWGLNVQTEVESRKNLEKVSGK